MAKKNGKELGSQVPTLPDGCYTDERSGTVDDDDGCTFGRPGSPRHAWIACEVDIGDDAAKRGW